MLVVVDTDVARTLPFTLRVRVMAGHEGGRRVNVQEWERARQGADAGVAFPASFAVVPGDGPRDGLARVELEGITQGSVIRRTVNVQFVPRLRGATVRVFLTSRCLTPATGCRATGAICTIQQLCEEQGQTCGNDGTCVAPETPVDTDPDAGFDVRTPVDTGVVEDVATDIPTVACGAYGQPCCTSGEACGAPFTCVAGTCRRCPEGSEACCNEADPLPNGTTCAMTMDPCKRSGTCTDGVCASITDAPNGTDCGANAGDLCRPRRACMAGACTGFINAMNGTQCAARNAEACQNARTCAGGVCQPATRFAVGATCRASGGPCELAATCNATGACPANPNRPNNYRPTSTTQCCGGNELARSNDNNCNVCGNNCSGNCAAHNIDGTTQWLCTCTTTASCGGTRVCRTLTPNANTCSCDAMNSNCPSGSRCQAVSGNPDICVPN